jgi:hypothetical protein
VRRIVLALALSASACASTPLEALQATARDPGLALSFFADRDGPCGGSQTAVVTRIPRLDDPVLGTDPIVELGPDDALIREWSVPIDMLVAGVRGDRVLLRDSIMLEDGRPFAYALEIAPDGAYSVVTLPEREPTATPCPSQTPFGDSAYAGCWSYADLDSGAERRLIWQGPCT